LRGRKSDEYRTTREGLTAMVPKLRRGYTKFCDILVAISLLLSQVFLVALIGMLAVEVVMRYVLNRSTGFADALSAYFLSGLVMMGITHTLRVGGHIKVEVLLVRMPFKFRSFLVPATILAAIVPIAMLAWVSLELVVEYYQSGRLSFDSILLVPMWIPLTVVPVGLTTFLLTMIEAVVQYKDEQEGNNV
jgi:TRAP-type C4-dicarboxylate transport system permease small subunit